MATSLGTPKLSTTLTFQNLCKKFPIFPSSESKTLRFRRFISPEGQRQSFSRHRRFTTTRAESTNGSGSGSGSESVGHYDFDLFTVGAGSGGVRASRFAANLGASVAVCELPFSTISSDTSGGVGGT